MGLTRSHFQGQPFHLVDLSPWPFAQVCSLLILTGSAVAYFQGVIDSLVSLEIGFITVVSIMFLWFRDVSSEGTKYKDPIQLSYQADKNMKLSHKNQFKALSKEEINEALTNYKRNNPHAKLYNSKKDLGYYLAGFLEGDGSISLPSLGVTTLGRVLNPRIVFTSHINNFGLLVFIQSLLGGVGRFQSNGNVIRYIIGDIVGIFLFIDLVHNKLRTPKNIRFNDLIDFMNYKYSTNIPISKIDTSPFNNNSWFTGFTEADGNFDIKYMDSKPKSDTRKRCVSENVSLRYRLTQRVNDKSTSSTTEEFMMSLASFLGCDLKTYYKNKT